MTSKYTIFSNICDEENEFKIQIADGCEEIEYEKPFVIQLQNIHHLTFDLTTGQIRFLRIKLETPTMIIF